jgi:hypothetical protein
MKFGPAPHLFVAGLWPRTGKGLHVVIAGHAARRILFPTTRHHVDRRAEGSGLSLCIFPL